MPAGPVSEERAVAVYTYRARDQSGEILRDTTEGSSVAEVVATLRRRGLLVIEVHEQGIGRWRFGGVRSSDLVVFTRQLATMVGAGLPIVRALRALSGPSDAHRLRPDISAVASDVESGTALSVALGRRKVFSGLYVEMVRAGEIGGMLDRALSRLASQLENDAELKRKVKGAMAYPVTVLVLAVFATAFMLAFVVPVFARMFEDLGGDLPLPTRIALGLSGLITGPVGAALALGCVGAAALSVRWGRSDGGRRAWGRASLALPLGLGDVARKVALARFARTLGALGAAGVPILQAVEVTARSCGNSVVEEALMRGREAVRAGASLHRALEKEPVFPPMVTRMISAGEESGELDTMLARIADFYESEVDATVKALSSIIEPVMIVVVGAIVGGIIVAMYLPMFRVFELIAP